LEPVLIDDIGEKVVVVDEDEDDDDMCIQYSAKKPAPFQSPQKGINNVEFTPGGKTKKTLSCRIPVSTIPTVAEDRSLTPATPSYPLGTPLQAVLESDTDSIPSPQPIGSNFKSFNSATKSGKDDDKRRKSLFPFQELGKSARKRFASIGTPGRKSLFGGNKDAVKPTALQQQASLIKYILAGEYDLAKDLLSSGCPKVEPVEASQLLLKCISKIELGDETFKTSFQLELITMLVDELNADVNSVDSEGRTALEMIVLAEPLIVRFLISRGANAMLQNNNGSCALSISFEYGIEMLYEYYISYGCETKLKESKDTDSITRYTACLISGGYGQKAQEYINEFKLEFSPEIATAMLEICKGNMENLKEPIETFLLLDSLGAVVE
jgi:hypothetical protein